MNGQHILLIGSMIINRTTVWGKNGLGYIGTGIYRRVPAWAIYSMLVHRSRECERHSIPVIVPYVPYMVQICGYVTVPR